MNILGDVQYSNTKSHQDYLKPELSVVVSMGKKLYPYCFSTGWFQERMYIQVYD